MAILAALVGRQSTGEGCYLDVSVADGVVALMALQVDDHLATGSRPMPGSAPLAGHFACYDVYRAGDGGWLAVAAIEAKFWANLCRLLSLDQLTAKQYDEHAQDAIRAALTTAFAGKSRDEWVALLAAADTCVSPVLELPEVAADAALRSRGTVTSASTADGRQLAQLGPLLAGAERRPAYDLPDHDVTATDSVLAERGWSTEEIAGLREQGVVQ
jgi:alpha-methylacyl-CoA racemase